MDIIKEFPKRIGENGEPKIIHSSLFSVKFQKW